MEHEETGCQPHPEGPILCVNNCGFFGSVATRNMCSKCHKDMMLKEEQAKLAASSFGNIVNGTSNSNGIEPVVAAGVECSSPSGSGGSGEAKPEGPKRCGTCNKRVGLTGFNCRCGHLFCAVHRYSDKHDCPYDYHTAARNAIAEANPVVKADKLDKI
ncbi:zinc finger A20 and AN1 domain-containing stress-associated protein 8 [Prunus yedoensis var. nudiflora]|uniref:Zinc finger A20 and AN1 domain-containing stress-associated protein 8 n=1 Tax=Prunus yedoensis var. nudiflora TaxID=2094558 RepID=A0A315ABK9_PRUYE|nr:zinc finger A20 and AN1 domain-containing stress-associated protein 8 [Prunus yedoensis var. nudiflora]